MRKLEHLIDLQFSDFCAIGALALLLWTVGDRIVAGKPHLRQWGLNLGGGSFLFIAIAGVIRSVPSEACDWLRLGAGSLLLAAVLTGLAWIALSVLEPLHKATIGGWMEALAEREKRGHQQRLALQRQREDQARQRRHQEEERRRAPEYERQRQEAEVRARAETEAKLRKEQARERCILFFRLNAVELEGRFKEEWLTDFLKDMDDTRTTEYVEEKSQRLIATMQQALEKLSPPPKFRSVDDINHWYEQQLQPILAMPDGRQRNFFIARLTERRDELITHFLENLES